MWWCWKMHAFILFQQKFLVFGTEKYLGRFFGHKKWAAENNNFNSRRRERIVQINDKPIKITEMIWHRIELRFNCSVQLLFIYIALTFNAWCGFHRETCSFYLTKVSNLRIKTEYKRELCQQCKPVCERKKGVMMESKFRWLYGCRPKQRQRGTVGFHIAHVFRPQLDWSTFNRKWSSRGFFSLHFEFFQRAPIVTCQRHTISGHLFRSFPKAFWRNFKSIKLTLFTKSPIRMALQEEWNE